MRLARILILTSLALTLTSCFSGPVSSTGSVGFGGGYIQVEAWASSRCVHSGDRVHLRATVTNKTSKTQTFETTDVPVLDLLVAYGKGAQRWSDGKPLTPDLTHLELQPGQSKTIEMDWIAQPTVGVVVATFFYSDRPSFKQEASVTIGVPCPGPFP